LTISRNGRKRGTGLSNGGKKEGVNDKLIPREERRRLPAKGRELINMHSQLRIDAKPINESAQHARRCPEKQKGGSVQLCAHEKLVSATLRIRSEERRNGITSRRDDRTL